MAIPRKNTARTLKEFFTFSSLNTLLNVKLTFSASCVATLRRSIDTKVILMDILVVVEERVRGLPTLPIYPLDTTKAGGIILATMHKSSGNTLEGKVLPTDE